jgi:hypothetical protein
MYDFSYLALTIGALMVSKCSGLVLVSGAVAALWAFGFSAPRDRVAIPETESPLTSGHALWDRSATPAHQQMAPGIEDATETEVQLRDWEYTAFPVSHWRR